MTVNYEAMTATGSYDYEWLFEPIRPSVSGADLSLCQMETSIAPEGEDPSGYPLFGAPPAIAPALKEEGWDGRSNANNHSADRGFAQVANTLDTFDESGLGHAGTARTEKEADAAQFYTLRLGDDSEGRELMVAHLSATAIDNDLFPIADAPWTWNVVENEHASRTADDVIEQARQAREKGADLVVLSFHWGEE